MPRGEILEQKTDAYIDGVWYTIARNTMTYNSTGKRITSENLAGQVTTTAWDCCHKVSENRTDVYGYNARGELVSGTKLGGPSSLTAEYANQYDDIGNRLTSLDLGTNRVYSANELNQYSSITTLTSDAGLMSYDRMGRRIEYLETISNGGNTVVTDAHHRFVYDGYLCIQRLAAAANNSIDLAFGWDPTEPVATRPLWMQRVSGTYNFFYFHDGNKNVSDVVSYQTARGVPAHYEYAPFGAVTAVVTNNAITAFSVAETNPFRFSSEYADAALGLVYYNYRHYNPVDGRWVSRDFFTEEELSYSSCNNNLVDLYDVLGMVPAKKEKKIWVKIVHQNEYHVHDCIEFKGKGNQAVYITHFELMLSTKYAPGFPQDMRGAFAGHLVERVGLSADPTACWSLVIKPFQVWLQRGNTTGKIYAAKLVIKVSKLVWYRDCGTCGVPLPSPASSTTTIGPYDVK